jgi:class 3 adenylate cyclase/tetratricopeptide (TPR) repeat protein
MTCPACGAPTPEGARFCPSCGQQIATVGDERRVVTVLFADLVGFTGLSEGRDPESVKHLVDRCFEHLVGDIKTFGGQVDKIVGDAIVALFGAPVAHEDDPERAVRAALRMQQTLTERAADLEASIRMRIGVNTGEVLVGALRAGGDYTAMGDVVNTASRLQTMAQPGEVLVGPATYAATKDIIGYQSVGAVEVRGRGDRVDAWRAITALAPPGYRRRRTRAPLIGRDTELGMIGHAIDNAVDRRRASVVTLLGEAGVGKNRLAREVATLAAQRHGAKVLEGRCVPYGEANVWWPIAEAVRHVFGVASDDAPELVREAVTAKVAEAADLPTDDASVSRLVNGLMQLLGAENPLRDIDPQRAREEMLRSVGGFFEALLADHPVMLVLSDLHWAGQPVFELLGSLLERLSDSPFLVVATARPPFRESWVPGDGRHNSLVVNVDPLSREATASLLDALFDGRVDTELRQVLLDRSGGNPFFLEELVALVDDGASLDTLARRAVGTDGLPDTLRGLVAARLDTLTRSERRALDDAAVYGREGPVDALVLMAAADRAGTGVRTEAEVRDAVSGLVDKEILVLDERGYTYSFRSDLVREVAYNTLTKAARAHRHWGIAQYLETNFARFGAVNTGIVDGLAHHYGQAAEQVRDLGGVAGIPAEVTDLALRWLTEAAERAEIVDAHPVAERLFTQALALSPPRPSPERVQLLLGRARARAEMRHLAAARTDLTAALDAAEAIEDRAGRARATLIRGAIEEREGDRLAAMATFTEAADEFTAAGDRQGMAESLRLRGMAELFAGDGDAAHRSISDAFDAFCALDDKRGQAWALQNLAWLAFLEGRPAEADRRIVESATMFDEIGDSGGLGWALGLQAWVRFHQGQWEAAEELSELILVESRGRGDRWASGMMLVLSASIRLWTGRAELALPRAQEAREVFGAIGDVEREVQSAAVLGRALIALGSVGEGFRTLDLAIETSRGATDSTFPMGATAVAAAAASIGDPERALRAVALVGLDDLDPGVVGESDRLVATGLALLQMEQVAEARSHLEAAAELDSEEDVSSYALSGLACVRAVEGRLDECRTLTDLVMAVGRSTYLDRVTALCALGAILMGVGQQAEADQRFDEATLLADGTDDRIAQALVRLARCEAARVTGVVLADLSAEVHSRLTELGIEAEGWLRVFRGAAMAGAQGPATPTRA